MESSKFRIRVQVWGLELVRIVEDYNNNQGALTGTKGHYRRVPFLDRVFTLVVEGFWKSLRSLLSNGSCSVNNDFINVPDYECCVFSGILARYLVHPCGPKPQRRPRPAIPRKP